MEGTYPVGLVGELLLPFVQKWQWQAQGGKILIVTDTDKSVEYVPNVALASRLIEVHNEPLDRVLK